MATERSWADALALVEDLVGCPRRETFERLDDSNGFARVLGLEVESEHGVQAIVIKRFDSPRLFTQESDALTRWFGELGELGELGGAQVPTLLASSSASLTLVCGRLSGVPAADQRPEGPAIYTAAGRFLAALHRLPLAEDDDPMLLADALARRYQAWARACDGALDGDELRVVRELSPSRWCPRGVARVPCHRDFAPNNWLWDGERLAVVDFEHARLDHGLGDLAKLAVAWADQPELGAAFFRGYGRPLSAAERTHLRGAVALHGLASLAWGLRHGEPRFVAEGRRALAEAGAWTPAS